MRCTYDVLQNPITQSAKTLPKINSTAAKTHMLQWRSKALTLASLVPQYQHATHITQPTLLQDPNSQLAIRPDANQHLRVAPHSRLQQRQRPVAHLPVFLHHTQNTTRSANHPTPFHHSIHPQPLHRHPRKKHTSWAISYSLPRRFSQRLHKTNRALGDTTNSRALVARLLQKRPVKNGSAIGSLDSFLSKVMENSLDIDV